MEAGGEEEEEDLLPPIPEGYVELKQGAPFGEFLLWTSIDDKLGWHRFVMLKVRLRSARAHARARTHAHAHARARQRQACAHMCARTRAHRC